MRWWYSQWQLKKIRPLKNEVTAWYFEIGNILRAHRILEGKKMQDYYAKIKYFKQRYHATSLSSQEVKSFHKSIQAMIGPILNKAFGEL